MRHDLSHIATWHDVRVTASGPSGRPNHQRNAEATRVDLLRAARRRFTVLGYDRTMTRDIAADAGVNAALINRYFGSKDGLFTAVVSESVDFLDDPSPTMIDSLVAGLNPNAWPEYGHEHPLLLLFQDAVNDEKVSDLRRRSLANGITNICRTTTADGTATSNGRLRAELVAALLAGVALLRKALPDEPLATTPFDELSDEMKRVITAILDTDNSRPTSE
jgi:AcrR family transcriptional regulator